MGKVRKKRKNKPKPFDPNRQHCYDGTIPVKVYQLAKAGLGNLQIARALGVEYKTFWLWRDVHPEVQWALDEARKTDGKAETFLEYVYDHLPEDLQDSWREILKSDKQGGSVVLEKMLKDKGRKGRQMLFLHALLHHNFNLSKACKAVMIPKTTLDTWLAADEEFSRLIEEMDWHKKNYFEDAFFQLVKEGNPSAVIYANKTYNADRGYGSKKVIEKNVNVSGSIAHGHAILDVSELDLPLEQRKKILQAMRAKKEALPQLEDK
jgi:hypothetical protein